MVEQRLHQLNDIYYMKGHGNISMMLGSQWHESSTGLKVQKNSIDNQHCFIYLRLR